LRYDLHAHTKASDGLLSPGALVQHAAECGLSGLAITDHDTVEGVAEAIAEGQLFGIEVIPGIELSIQAGDEDVHMLGYWIDHESPDLTQILRELFEMRLSRAGDMVARIVELGYPIDLADVLDQAGDGAPGRPHVGKALLSRGHVASLEEAFERFIGDGRPAFVPKSRMDPERGFTLLRRFGAVPVWAHPALVDHRRHLPAFIELGLAGLEVDHPKQDLHERAALRAVCREHDLIATGGSDFHGFGTANRGLGSHGVSAATLSLLRARRPAPATP